jgi:hypothetical protein
MKISIVRIALCSLLLCTVLLSPATSDEGMWLMTQLDKLPLREMQAYGLRLSPRQIYNEDSVSLKDAIVLFGGGTSSFVSPEGLVLTNHHVAFAAIQSISSTSEDYLKNGFYAPTKDKEISIPSYTAQIVVSTKDVTGEVLGSISDTLAPGARSKAVTAKLRELEKAAKGTSDIEYRIAEMYNGVRYTMFGYQVLRDVRLVYAPPTSIGNYGGEVDNWYWPRHTGDFSFMRVYVAPDGKPAKYAKENVPYKPATYLPFSMDGVKEGDFAMIMGFPGRTFRYRTTPEVQLARDETMPMTMKLFKLRMDIITAAGNRDRAIEIKYASKWRGLANTYKNYQGTLEGMTRSHIMKQREELEREFLAFLRSKPELEAKYGTVLSDIARTYDELKTFNRKTIVIGQLYSSSDLVRLANRFKEYAQSFAPDSTGKPVPSPAMAAGLKDAISATFKDMDLGVDRQLLAALILEATELPYEQRVERVARIVGTKTGEQRERAVRDFVNDLFNDTELSTPERASKLTTKSAKDILNDDLVRFVLDLDKDNAPLMERVAAFNATIGRDRARLLEAWMAWKGPDIYPDANRTLRLTYGKVDPYKPRDAVYYDYVTTLGGVMEKETGEDPFQVPAKLRELWEAKDFGRYADLKSGDVPVAFIAELDITGGNSGSPVINGRGELIGLAFDGNWESVVCDWLYVKPLNRAINVDARYILFVVDKFSNAQELLSELNVSGVKPGSSPSTGSNNR